ncbi:MAG: hypothetical protein Kow0083_06150 [Methylophaga sp.]
MQIKPTLTQQSEVVREVSARLLAALTEGQPVEAKVMARLSADSLRVQIGNSQYQIQTRQSFQSGQMVQLERGVDNGKPVIRVTPVVAENNQTAVLLKQGQLVAVEVVKVLAENRLLVSPSLIGLNSSRPAQPGTSSGLPPRIEIDISSLQQQFRPGERLALEVLREQPLLVQLKAGSPSRAELIQQYQREVLPHFNRAGPAFNTLSQLPAELPVAQVIRRGVNQLLQGLSERQSLQQAEGLRQALNNSGLFLENRLSTGVSQTLLKQDLKANLLQLAEQLKMALSSTGQFKELDMQRLPGEVQRALQQLVNTPQDLRKLPAQVPPALASRGQTPMQLLLGLLAGLASHGASESTAFPASAALMQAKNMTGVQAFIQAREMAAAPAQAMLRAAEWQILRDLLREVESASARIQFNQLSMLRDPDNPSNTHVWLFDIPVRDKQQLEMLQMRLEQHSANLTEGDDAIWQVQLNLETQNLGLMQARISLHQQDVKVVLLAERQESSELLSHYIDDLSRRLDQLGVHISHLSCRQAPIKPLTAEPEAVLPQHILDISV